MDVEELVNEASVPILSADVPVEMPDLPLRISINSAQQLKALGDPIRLRVLNIIRHQPATAKQLADRLQVSPGAMGHHLRVLLDAGLAQVVARRLQRGIVASYYTRTARIFDYDLPPELKGDTPASLDILTQARDELAETLAEQDSEQFTCIVGLPHVRLSQERRNAYVERVSALINEFLNEPPDLRGEVFTLCVGLFSAPQYMQTRQGDEGQA
jgi:DNA-binding transcriptional ArsR family regulator